MFEGLTNYLPAFGIIALLFVFYKNSWVSKQDPGNEKMQFIAANIAKGAMAFLKAEYKILSIFVVAVAILLFLMCKHLVEETGTFLSNKLKNLKDLSNINTLGFRGEALPSIASISEITLKSKTSKHGTYFCKSN